jgi:hypothetical protein
LNRSLELALLKGLLKGLPTPPPTLSSLLLLAELTLLLVSSLPASILLLNAVEMKIRRLVFRSRIGGSGAGSVRVSGLDSAGGGAAVNVAGRSRLNRMGSFSAVRSALDVEEKELVSDEVDEEIGVCVRTDETP